jgi:hypothetical protein
VVAVVAAAATLALGADSASAQGVERQRRWWTHARQVLFDDLALSPEQTRQIDALIETQLAARTRLQQLDTDLAAAQRDADAERADALRAERPAIRARLEGPDEVLQQIRGILTEEQRPNFDMNRARLLAEGQKAMESRQRPRPQPPATDASEEK